MTYTSVTGESALSKLNESEQLEFTEQLSGLVSQPSKLVSELETQRPNLRPADSVGPQLPGGTHHLWVVGEGRTFACFLSHTKEEAGADARYLRDLLERMLGCRVYLDSAELTDLRTLFTEGVQRSEVLVLLGTQARSSARRLRRPLGSPPANTTITLPPRRPPRTSLTLPPLPPLVAGGALALLVPARASRGAAHGHPHRPHGRRRPQL